MLVTFPGLLCLSNNIYSMVHLNSKMTEEEIVELVIEVTIERGISLGYLPDKFTLSSKAHAGLARRLINALLNDLKAGYNLMDEQSRLSSIAVAYCAGYNEAQ